MAELPPEIAGLIEAARSAHDPSDADCERVRRGLQAAIVAQAATTPAATPDGAASAASHGGLGALVATTGGKLLLAVALMGGATGLWSWRSRSESPRATPAGETQHTQADEQASPPAASVETPRAQTARRDGPASPPAASVQGSSGSAGAASALDRAERPAALDRAEPPAALDRAERPAALGRAEHPTVRGRTDQRAAPAQAPSDPATGPRGVRPRLRWTRGADAEGAGATSTSSAQSASDPAASDGRAARDTSSQGLVRSSAAAPETARGGHATKSGETSRAPAADEASPDTLTAAPTESEVTLIRGALRSLNAGAPQRTLELLDAHAARHPAGAMARERAGLRVLALCAAGRWHEGRLEQAAFLDSASDSPLQKRVRNACKDQPK